MYHGLFHICDQRSFFESWMEVKIKGCRIKLSMAGFFVYNLVHLEDREQNYF